MSEDLFEVARSQFFRETPSINRLATITDRLRVLVSLGNSASASEENEIRELSLQRNALIDQCERASPRIQTSTASSFNRQVAASETRRRGPQTSERGSLRAWVPLASFLRLGLSRTLYAVTEPDRCLQVRSMARPSRVC